jgi:hypothetical protein
VEARDEARWVRRRRELSEDAERGESRGRNAEPGSGFPGLGAPEGHEDLKGGGSETDGWWSRTERTARDGDAEEILEGERKARSGIQANQETDSPAIHRKTSRSTPKGGKGAGGAGKPDERLRRMVRR